MLFSLFGWQFHCISRRTCQEPNPDSRRNKEVQEWVTNNSSLSSSQISCTNKELLNYSKLKKGTNSFTYYFLIIWTKNKIVFVWNIKKKNAKISLRQV